MLNILPMLLASMFPFWYLLSPFDPDAFGWPRAGTSRLKLPTSCFKASICFDSLNQSILVQPHRNVWSKIWSLSYNIFVRLTKLLHPWPTHFRLTSQIPCLPRIFFTYFFLHLKPSVCKLIKLWAIQSC